MKIPLRIVWEKISKRLSNFWFFYGALFFLLILYELFFGIFISHFSGISKASSEVSVSIYIFLNMLLVHLLYKKEEINIWKLLLIGLSPFLCVVFTNGEMADWFFIYWGLIISTIFIWYAMNKKLEIGIFSIFIGVFMLILPWGSINVLSKAEDFLSNKIKPSVVIDMWDFRVAMSRFYKDNNYYSNSQNGICLKNKKGETGALLQAYFRNTVLPIYPQETGKGQGNIYFCSKETPIWYMPWKTKKIGTREYWYKTLSYKEEEDQAYLLCAEVNNKDKLNAKQGVENVQSYEEAKKYMEHYKNPSLSWKETEELMEDYRNNVDVYIYCTLNNLDNT